MTESWKQQWAVVAWVMVGGLAAAAVWRHFASDYEFEKPYYLWGLAVVPAVFGLFAWLAGRNPNRVRLSGLGALPRNTGVNFSLRHLPASLKTFGAGMLVLVLAKPHSKDSFENITREGIDIAMALDLSASMLAMDFKPNRLESARETALEFVQARPNDRFAVVLYEGESYTRVPLTTDHRVVLDAIAIMNTGFMEQGTAIGMGLATAVNRLKNSDGKSKVIILLTDGKNNRGSINPVDASKMALAYDMRVYTIGVGTRGKAKTPVAMTPDGSYIYDWVDVDIDEDLLKTIASTTGGKYFRATSQEALKSIYREIDELEKTKFNISRYNKLTEEFYPFALAALTAIFGAFVLNHLLIRSTP